MSTTTDTTLVSQTVNALGAVGYHVFDEVHEHPRIPGRFTLCVHSPKHAFCGYVVVIEGHHVLSCSCGPYHLGVRDVLWNAEIEMW